MIALFSRRHDLEKHQQIRKMPKNLEIGPFGQELRIYRASLAHSRPTGWLFTH